MTTRPIRVMQVLEATRDGTRRHLNELVAALSSSGSFELHIVCAARRDPTFRDDIEAYRRAGHVVSILPMTRGAHPFYDPLSLWKLRRLLRRWPCDVLHLHSAKAGFLGRLAARGLGCVSTVIYSPHAFPFLQRVARPIRRTYELLERALAPYTDLVLAVSPAEGRLAMETGLFPEHQIVVLPNALDVPQLDRQTGVLAPIPEPEAGRTLVLLGELRAQKDPYTFLEATRRLRERRIPARFAVPARGCELDRVRRYLHRHRLESVVDLIPAESSFTALHQRTDIGVLPSLWEGLPYTILETLALRRPVIASSLPVFEDLLSSLDPRLLFPPGGRRALADTMELWARLPTRELVSVGDRARRRVKEHHDMGAWRRELLNIYHAVATDSSAPR